MNQRVNSQQIVPLLFVVFLVAVLGILVAVVSNGTPVSVAPLPPAKMADQTSAAAFNAAEAADLSAARWQAMAKFYEENGMLTRDPFDYQQAAELSEYRWEAMARFYEENGLLNDRMDSGDLSAYRWNAMARAYERMGLLNE
jgi:hypothetical protein